MSITEFKSWLNGYLEGIGDTPNKAQWERIKQNIDKLLPALPNVNVPFHTITPRTADFPSVANENFGPFPITC